jgi:hypothetical protein
MRPDGSELDVVMTGGMDNPVDIAFSAAGEMFVSGTFFVQPAGGKRDGILHAVHGGVWGKDHAVLEGHPRTGDLMPIMTHVGPAAASGLEMARSDALGLRGNLLCCQFNLRKVSRHVCTRTERLTGPKTRIWWLATRWIFIRPTSLRTPMAPC